MQIVELELLKIDPLIKNQINNLDTQRSIRAYEIKSYTKKSITSWFKNTKSDYDKTDFFKIGMMYYIIYYNN